MTLVPFIIFLIIIPIQSWMDVIFYNFAYAKNSLQEKTAYDQQSWQNVWQHLQHIYAWVLSKTYTFPLLMILGFISCFYRPFLRKTNFLPIIVLMMLILDFCAVVLSGYKIGHYYLQLIPSLMLLSACGIALLTHFSSKQYLFEIILILIIPCFFIMESNFIQRLQYPMGNPKIGALSQRLIELKQPGDTLWCNLGDNSKYYVESNMLSPTKYLYVFPHSFLDTSLTTGEGRRQEITSDILENPPRFMILSDAGIVHLRELGFDQLMDFVDTHYQRNTSVREGDKFIYEYGA